MTDTLAVPTTRNRKVETKRAKENAALRLGELAAARHDQSLGDDYIKLAQFMILCTLPYSEQDERQITRRARMGDGSYLEVTFTALRAGVPLPFGADRKLLAWLFDRAIRAKSAFIPWESAQEYQREMGLSMSGRSNRQLSERFQRIAGLGVNIVREGDNKERVRNYLIFEDSFLPKSITGKTLEASGQQRLPELQDNYGFAMHGKLFGDIQKYHIALPRQLWRELPGTTQVQDLVYFLIWRSYSAASQSVIPWESLQEQFPQDSNPRRFKANAREAVRLLRIMWPSVRLEAGERGIEVDRPAQPLLENDEAKGRVRRIARKG
ncbi:MAG: hypothetical protein ACRYFU_23870 [Janthinobacterium lividum]